MDLLQNPFYILAATQRDNLYRIMELAAEQRLLLDTDECIAAQATLTNPRKRISAEMAWLPGVAPERASDILMLLEGAAENHPLSVNAASIIPDDSLAAALLRLPYAKEYNVADKILELLKRPEAHFASIGKFLGIESLTPIARANLLAARIARLRTYAPDVVAEWILAIAQAFENVNPTEVCATLNKDRRVSGFPEITDLSTIESEIQQRRLHYRQVIKSALENISVAKVRVQAVTIVLLEVEAATESAFPIGSILIDDAIDAYEIGVQSFLESVENNIETLEQRIRVAAEHEKPAASFELMVDELIEIVKEWGIITRPIQLKKKRQGLHDTASSRVGNRVREFAIHLFNEYDKLRSSQQILTLLQKVFSEISEIVEGITVDLETLNKIAKQREQKSP